MTDNKKPIEIGLVLYPELTQLDLTGPYEVFARAPGTKVHLLWKTLDPITSDSGMTILPTMTFDDCPQLDVLCVPGGPGQIDYMADEELLGFLRRQGEGARYVTSVCTGSLLLGAAGLMQGYKATTYWASTEFLAAYGAEFTPGRVVKDRNRITGGGVTAGIDFALVVVAELFGDDVAKAVQLMLEYNPAPPFTSGHPDVAEVETVEALRALMQERIAARIAQAEAARSAD